jgi:hypothetical protein
MLDGFSDVTKDEKRYYVEFVCSETKVRPVHNISFLVLAITVHRRDLTCCNY